MSSTKKVVLFIGDIALLYVGLILTLFLRYSYTNFEARFGDHFLPFSALFVVWLTIFWIFDFYRQRAFVNYNALANRILVAVGVAVLSSVVLFYLFEAFFQLTPKTNLMIFAATVAILEYIFRASFLALAKFRPEPALVIGDSPEIQELITFLKKYPHAGYQATEWLKPKNAADLDSLEDALARSGAKTIIILASLTREPSIMRALYSLLPQGVRIINFNDFYELVFERVPLAELTEGWFIEHITTRRPVYDRAKVILDYFFASLLFIILLPLNCVIAILIKLTSKGPVIFKQKRYGKNDRVFTLYKFRTMRHNAEGAYWTEKNDPRITLLGRFLRAAHLDEFPQLWNILKGDTSFIGPRPERVELADQFRAFPYYTIRHVVKPGVTGWAQINFRPSASVDEAKEKLKYDIYYVKNRSFLLDIAILLKTAKYMFVNAENPKI